MTRTFIAIELQKDARDALRREIARLRAALPGVRFVDPASLHLTLAFLGELNEERLAAAIQATEEAAAETSAFALEIAGIGTFGGSRAPRVIWAGVAGEVAALRAVQARLTRALEAHGFAAEARTFAPHLTLARLNAGLELESAHQLEMLIRDSTAEGPLAALPVDALSVMKSDLSRALAHATHGCEQCRS